MLHYKNLFKKKSYNKRALCLMFKYRITFYVLNPSNEGNFRILLYLSVAKLDDYLL